MRSTRQRNAAARDNTFLDRGTGGMQRVIDAVLAFLHFNFGSAANADDRDAPGEFCESLLQLLFVVVRRRFLALRADLRDAAGDIGLLASAFDDRRRFFLDQDFLRIAEHLKSYRLQLDAEVFRDDLATGEDRDVFQYRLPAIAEARRLDGRDLQTATQLVDDECCERFALDIFGDDQQRLTCLYDGLEQREERLELPELLLEDQNVWAFQIDDHLLRVGDEVGRDITAVELHAFNHIQLGLDAFGLFNCNDALLADLLHRLGDHFADLGFAIGGNRTNLRGLRRGGDLFCALLKFRDNGNNRFVDSATQIHRVQTGRNGLNALADDRLRQHGRGRRAVAGEGSRLACNFPDQLSAKILELVGKFDFLGNRHAVLGNARGAVTLLKHHITALWAKRDLYGIGQDVHATQNAVAGIGPKTYVFGSHVFRSYLLILRIVRRERRGRAV